MAPTGPSGRSVSQTRRYARSGWLPSRIGVHDDAGKNLVSKAKRDSSTRVAAALLGGISWRWPCCWPRRAG